MKRKLIDLLFALIFLIGFGIFAYPAVSDQWNAYRQSKLISTYEEVMSELEPEDYSREWGTARAFNDAIAQNDFTGDAFGSGDTDIEDTEYWKVLNAAENGVMGYLSIPKIDVRLSVYHGTADDILQTGIGHVSGTKLPIGGDGTHSVLAAHRGLPSATLFTDLDRLEEGDYFLLYILDDILCYQVDQTTVVEPQETEALAVVKGEDLVTLLTCTPYGVNSHRLLVRGHRVAYEPEVVEESVPTAMPPSLHTNYLLWVIIGLSATAVFIFLLYLLDRRRRSRAASVVGKKALSAAPKSGKHAAAELPASRPETDASGSEADWIDLDSQEEKS